MTAPQPRLIRPSDEVFVLGDYFSRQLSEQIVKIGHPLAGTVLGRVWDLRAVPAEYLDRHTPADICREVRWAADLHDQRRSPSLTDCSQFFLDCGEGKGLDAALPIPRELKLDALLEQRRTGAEVLSSMFRASCVIFVFSGLRHWRDLHTGMFSAFEPPQRLAERFPGRFVPEELQPSQALRLIEETIGIIKRINPGCSILLGVSPLATGPDSAREKAALSEVCRQAAQREEAVAYLPFYEELPSVSELKRKGFALVTELFERVLLPYFDCSEDFYFFWKSYASELLGNSLDALEFAARAAVLNPANIRFLCSHAERLADEDLFSEAEAILAEAHKLDAANAKLRQVIVSLCWRRKNRASPLLPPEEAVEGDTSRIESRICFSSYCRLFEKHELAEQVLREARALYPWAPDSRLELSYLLRRERAPEAAKFAAEALELWPAEAGPWAAHAELLARAGEDAAADAAFQKMLELDPWSAALRKRYVNWLLNKNRTADALRMAEQGLLYSGTEGDALVGWAHALKAAGRGIEAKQQLMRAAQLHPSLLRVRRELEKAG